jgi:hypothetical protein
MLDAQNQGPQCKACGSPMKLTAIEPSDTGRDLRTFTCPYCSRVQRHFIESTVAEAWLEPKRGIKVRQGNAITHAVDKGRALKRSRLIQGEASCSLVYHVQYAKQARCWPELRPAHLDFTSAHSNALRTKTFIRLWSNQPTR